MTSISVFIQISDPNGTWIGSEIRELIKKCLEENDIETDFLAVHENGEGSK